MAQEPKKPILQVKNVWCPKCGRQEFEHMYSILLCTNCGASVEWSTTWNEWFGRSSSGQWILGATPPGTKWEQCSTGWWSMIDQYDPNTGKKLKDPGIRDKLLKQKEGLEFELAVIHHKIENT